jgi:hypothetical protein
MKYDKAHGIEGDDGVRVIFHGCRCQECNNIVMDAKDSDGGSVWLSMSPGSFRRLLGQMTALAEHVALDNDPSPALDGNRIKKQEGPRSKNKRKGT